MWGNVAGNADERMRLRDKEDATGDLATVLLILLAEELDKVLLFDCEEGGEEVSTSLVTAETESSGTDREYACGRTTEACRGRGDRRRGCRA